MPTSVGIIRSPMLTESLKMMSSERLAHSLGNCSEAALSRSCCRLPSSNLPGMCWA